MPRPSRVGAVLTVTVLLAALVLTLPARAAGPTTDARQVVSVPAAGREKMLAEMRQMLESVNAVLQALVGGDVPAVEKAARLSGMAAVGGDMPLMAALPMPFRQLGMQTHQAFDALGDRARAGAGRDELLQGLGRITNNCVACHAIYRLDESR